MSDDARCLDCGRSSRHHRLATVRAGCDSGDEWGRYKENPGLPVEDVDELAMEHVGYRYRHESNEQWSFAPISDRPAMETMEDKGWQVEPLYRRTGEDSP